MPPIPAARPEGLGPLGRVRAFRRDIFAAQPERLYRAWMAEQRAPLYRSYVVNDPALVREVLTDRAAAFPKSAVLATALRPVLGRSVFLENGGRWARLRRVIDPAFAGGRVRAAIPDILAAGAEMLDRLAPEADLQREASRTAADIIVRTLFGRPLADADGLLDAFARFQAGQPLLNPLDLMRAPAWLPRPRRGATRRAAAEIRARIAAMIADGADGLAESLLTTLDPDTGRPLTRAEAVDQIATFFLAGHETSAAALAWTLYCLALDPEAQEAARAERGWDPGQRPFTRDVWREGLRLYPPVPMVLRDAAEAQVWRGRRVRRGALVLVSPWHLHRHRRFWDAPDAFDPWRWQRPETRESQRIAYLPFSAGPRMCPGAGFALAEGVLLIAQMLERFRLAPLPGCPPRPVGHLTVRSATGVWLRLT